MEEPRRHRTLVLLTGSYPYRSFTEEVFVTPELEALSREFERIIVVPLLFTSNGLIDIDLPSVEADLSMAQSALRRFRPLRLPWLAHPRVIKDAFALAGEARSPRKWLTAMFFAMNSAVCARLVGRILSRHKLDPDTTLLYTYWFNHVTAAATQLRGRDGRHFKVITRAHGHDIFDNQVAYRSHRQRRATLAGLSGVYTASTHGRDYLRADYPEWSHLIETKRLGSVKPTGAPTMAACHIPEQREITLLTCARVSPEKRVGLALEFAAALAQAYSLHTVRWIHVGDGQGMADLRRAAKSPQMPANLIVDLRGALPNSAVHQIYANEPIDWFVLTSSSEGLPIAICEALSYGVPVVATDVGGVAEAVTPDVGVLVAPDATPRQMVGELQPWLDEPRFYQELRQAAAERWNNEFSARSLSEKFAKQLSAL